MTQNNGRNDGPPDLDEIFAQIRRKFSQVFGGGQAPQTPTPSSSGPNPLWILGVAMAGLWLATGFYIVDERERGVIFRFGAVDRISEPGLRWHLPYPIEQREVVKVTEARSVEIGNNDAEALMLTGDENIVSVQYAVQYSLYDPKAYVLNNRFQDDDAKDLVKQAAETAMRAMIGRTPIDSALNEGRDRIASETRKHLQTILDHYQSGIRVDQVNLRSIQPPKPVQESFQDVLNAGQDKDRLNREGEAYANNVVPKAEGEANSVLEQARAYQQTVVQTARGDAARFNQLHEQYKKAPQVTRDRLYLETLQEVLGNQNKVLVESGTGTPIIYLPGDSAAKPAPEVLPNSKPATPLASSPRDPVEARTREVRP